MELQDTSKLRAVSDALVAGAKAFMDGKSLTDNPYDRETQRSDWSDWRFAYGECEHLELQEKHDAPQNMS